jgi:hypothetical protein
MEQRMTQSIPTVGSVWGTVTNREFVVEEIIKKDNQIWVHYSNEKSTYNCLLDAFVSRFNPHINQQNKKSYG